MIAHFPDIKEDELLYSAILRYHQQSGNISINDTTIDLFGKRKRYIIADLTTDLEAFVENTKHLFNCIDDNDLLVRHTLFNYYTNFIKSDIKQKLRERVLKNSGSNILHYSTGQNAGIVKEPEFFRYCPICVQKDLEVHGFTYWRTYQQLPSVFTCKDHFVALKESSNLIRASYEEDKNKMKLIIENRETINLATINEQLLHSITVESYKITVKDYNFSDLRLDEVYRYLLKKKGYMKVSGVIDQQRLREDFISYFKIDFLKLLQSIPSGYEGSCWLRSILRKHRKSFHPIRHLLLINFLDESVDTIHRFSNNKEQPFGEGPHLCLNPAADHYLKPVISDLSITRCTDTKRPVGTFRCTCGFVYSRRGPDLTTEDKKKIGRIKDFGSVWHDKLDQLINVDKLSFYASSKILNVDIKTIIKYSSQKELPDKTCRNVLSQHIKDQWLRMIQEHPLLTKTELRRMNPALYSKIYRADKSWLNNNSPKIKQKNEVKYRVDWETRDFESLIKIKEVVKELYSRKKPIRVSKSLIGKVSKKKNLIEKKAEKIPVTMKYISEVTESISGFRKRRILWAIEELCNEDLKVWKVLRKAGVNKKYYHEVEYEIDKKKEKT